MNGSPTAPTQHVENGELGMGTGLARVGIVVSLGFLVKGTGLARVGIVVSQGEKTAIWEPGLGGILGVLSKAPGTQWVGWGGWEEPQRPDSRGIHWGALTGDSFSIP